MKILVVAPQPFFSPRGTPFSVYYRTMITSELGAEIDFLTYGQGQEVEIPNVRFLRIPKFRWLGDVKIGPSMLKLFFDIFIAFRMLTMCIRNRYSVVHAHEEAVFLAYFLKPIFRFKLIYDMHSSLPQQLSNFNFTTSKFLIGIFKRLEDACLKKSEAIITICPALFDYVNTIIENKDIHFLIENSIFDPVKLKTPDANQTSSSTEEVFKKLDITVPEGNKLVVYAGTLEDYQGIDILLKAFQLVVDNDCDAFLLIAGGTTAQVNHYQKLANDLGISQKVKFTGRLPQNQARTCTEAADVLMSPRSTGTNTPLKVYEQLASGIPLVATNIYSHTQVLDDSVAFLVDPEPGSMAAGLKDAIESETKVQSVIENAKRLYEEKYSRRVYTEKMTRLLEIVK